MITTEQAYGAVQLMTICRYFPSSELQRAQISALLVDMVETKAQLGRVHTIRSASTMSAKQRNARKMTSSFSKREKMRRKPFSLRKSRSISLRFL